MRKLATGIVVAFVAAALVSAHSIAVEADASADECWEAKAGEIQRSSLPVGYGPMKFDREGNLYCWSNCYPAACGFTLTKVTRDLQRAWKITRTPEPGFAALALADCAIDSSGRVFLTAWSATNGATSVQQEILVWCYDRDGTALWTNRYTSEGLPHGIGADTEGNVYVVGTTSEGVNKPEGFIELVKLDAAGERCWRTLYDGPSHESTRISSIATGPGGMVCFGLGRHGGIPMSVVMYGADGALRWVSTSPPFYAKALSIVIDSAGKVVVSVRRGGTGGAPFDTAFVVKFDGSGRREWVWSIQTPSREFPIPLHVDEVNQIYLSAVWEIDGHPLTAVKLDPAGRDLWLVAFDGKAPEDPRVLYVGAVYSESDSDVRIAGWSGGQEPLVIAHIEQKTAAGRPMTQASYLWSPIRLYGDLGSTVELPTRLIAGSEPLSYQWRRNGADIPGATNASLFITNVADTDGGIYQQLVRNPFGCSLSPELTLYVLTSPAPQLADVRMAGTELSFILNGRTNVQYQVETSTDLQHWTWCCSRWSGPVSMARPPGDSVFVRVGIYVPTGK